MSKESVCTVDAAAALMVWRDEFIAKAKELEASRRQKEVAFKAEDHQLKMQVKALKREADKLQATISAEMLAKVVAKKQLEEEYRFKTPSDFEQLTEDKV